MIELYVLRHAIAVPRGTPGFKRDSQRPLTAKGEKKMWRISAGMKQMGLGFDLILSSPYVRAMRTAEVVAKTFKATKLLKDSADLEADGDPALLIESLNGPFKPAKKIVIVGHEPYLSRLISMLVAGHARMSLTLKKGGLCKLTAGSLRYGRCATLEWLLTSRQMILRG
jgi:phosphohistidine phosphatase